MPSFLSRPKRMSAHRPRPRSGQFTFDGHRLKQLHSDPPSSGLPSTPRRSSAPFAPHQSPAALIIDGGGSGGGGACADAREQPQQKKQPNRHRRVVSVSWPGDISLKSQWHDKDDNQRDLEWEQHLQDMSRRSSSTKSSSSSADEEPPVLVGLGLGATAAARPAAVEAGAAAAAAAATVNVKVVAPNKRQRQMDYSKTRVSSGPIDIPPSPRTTGDRDEAEGGERGAKAATDAGEWYPCWTPSRPDDNKCGEKGGPPEHILIWERAVKQQRQQQQQQEQQPEEGAGRAEIVEQDEDVEDVGDDSDDDGLQQRRPERRMSSDQPIFDMDL